MKVSDITYTDIANYIRLTEVSQEEQSLLTNLISIAKAFIKDNTGVEDLDEFERIRDTEPERILQVVDMDPELMGKATDSSTRAGCYIRRA